MRQLFTLLLLLVPSLGVAQPSHCIALAEKFGADYRPIPASFRDPLSGGDVRISYIAHASFLIQTPGGASAVTDYTGFLGTADFTPDVVTMNNAHDSHWTEDPDENIPYVLNGWPKDGEPAHHAVAVADLRVRNVTTNIRSGFGTQHDDGNSIFLFEAAGLCIGHVGHLHHEPSDAQYALIGRLDVVMVPVDGGMTLPVTDLTRMLNRMRARIVLPMHWFGPANLQRFLSEVADDFDVVEIGETSLKVNLDRLPSRPQVIVLRSAYLRDPRP